MLKLWMMCRTRRRWLRKVAGNRPSKNVVAKTIAALSGRKMKSDFSTQMVMGSERGARKTRGEGDEVGIIQRLSRNRGAVVE